MPLHGLLLSLLLVPVTVHAQPTLDVAPYRATADRIIAAALADSAAWHRLVELCDTFGHRLSGSQALEDAIDWALAEMQADGLANVYGQPVLVPHWVRGAESATLVQPRVEALPMLGLGGSIGTPPEGVTAEVIVVRSFDELEARRADLAGRIVLFNVPFTTYGQTVQYRTLGAVRAAQYGAVASLIRSVGPFSMQTPHTGAMRYQEGVRQIPHAALAAEAADLLDRFQARGITPVVTLTMEAQTLPDAPSRNVIAELVGRERPEEVVVIGGHLDSWDVGQGAMDDGGGSVVAWEAVKLLKDLGLRPRRTIRVVLWTNEENGLRGGQVYRDSLNAADLANHQLAIESDGGVFAPVGFGFGGTDEALALLQPIEALLAPVLEPASDAYEVGIVPGGGGADIGPLMRDGVPGLGLNVQDARYFWFHHTPADTVDKLDPVEMQRCVAVMAIMAYVAAEMPERLPQREAVR